MNSARQPNSEAAAFETVYRAEVRGVWGFLRRLGATAALADDLTQQTFLVAFGRWKQLDPSRAAGPWLRGIAWRLHADERRLHFKRDLPADELASVRANTPVADEHLGARRTLAALEAALAQLNDEQRAVFVLHEMEGVSIDAIATEMGAPVPTIYSRLRLARQRLSAALVPHREGVLP